MKTRLSAVTTRLPNNNHFLAALPTADYERLLPHLEPVALPLGWSVYESGSTMSHVYFPTEGIVSLLCVLEDGASAEIAIIGREGVVGLSLLMGGGISPPYQTIVQSAGYAWRLPANFLTQKFTLGDELQHLTLRFAQSIFQS